jgi:hypothetical protein
MSFPTNPEINSQHPQGGRIWQWDGQKWVLMSNPVSDIDFRSEEYPTPITVEEGFEIGSDGTTVPFVETGFDITSLPSLD